MNIWRWLRILMGIMIIVQSFFQRDVLFGIAGLVFTLMAIFNVGCCGPAGCGVNQSCDISRKAKGETSNP